MVFRKATAVAVCAAAFCLSTETDATRLRMGVPATARSTESALVSHTAVALFKQQPQMSAECRTEVMKLKQSMERQQAAAKCEQDEGYAKDVVAKLKLGAVKDAEGVAATSMQKCAKLPEKCAKSLAPVVVVQVRVSGVAVETECKAEMMKLQKAKATSMKEVEQCETKMQFSQKLSQALNANQVQTAFTVTEKCLAKCASLTEKCASQLAPIVVRNIVQRAKQQAAQQKDMMIVFATAGTTMSTTEAVPELAASVL